MKRGLPAAVTLALMTATPTFAAHRHTGSGGFANWGSDHSEGDDASFSAATLTGIYLFEASGFMDDGAPGSVGVLGTLTFDGVSAVSGNLTLTAGDTGQWSCGGTFTNGTYTYRPRLRARDSARWYCQRELVRSTSISSFRFPTAPA
jgi:hypothetical protein